MIHFSNGRLRTMNNLRTWSHKTLALIFSKTRHLQEGLVHTIHDSKKMNVVSVNYWHVTMCYVRCCIMNQHLDFGQADKSNHLHRLCAHVFHSQLPLGCIDTGHINTWPTPYSFIFRFSTIHSADGKYVNSHWPWSILRLLCRRHR